MARKTDVICEDLTEAFDVCRERNRPLVVELESPDPDKPEAKQFKVFPSGQLRWAYDGESTFRVWE
jgi:hypothetical protein